MPSKCRLLAAITFCSSYVLHQALLMGEYISQASLMTALTQWRNLCADQVHKMAVGSDTSEEFTILWSAQAHAAKLKIEVTMNRYTCLHPRCTLDKMLKVASLTHNFPTDSQTWHKRHCLHYARIYVLLLKYLVPHHHLLIQLTRHLLHVCLRMHMRVLLWGKREEEVGV